MPRKTRLQLISEELGPQYRIKYIDWEKCIYRDLENGFDIEVSGVYGSLPSKTIHVYLWRSEGAYIQITSLPCKATAESIREAVQSLCELSEELIKAGAVTRESINRMDPFIREWRTQEIEKKGMPAYD